MNATMPEPDPDFPDPGMRSEGPAMWWEAPLYLGLLGLAVIGLIVAISGN